MKRAERPSSRPTSRSSSAPLPTSDHPPSSPPSLAPPPAARGQAGRIAKLRRELTDRDLAVLTSLYHLRLLTTDHIERLHLPPAPTASARRRRTQRLLRRLAQLRLVHQVGRRLGGVHAGSSDAVFALTGLGLAVLDLPGPYGRRRRTLWTTKPYFHDHMLAVADAHVGLVEACRSSGAELLAFEAEPACWRRFSGAGGETVVLKPDAFVRVGVGDYALPSFVEVDLGSESLPTIRRKCQTYVDYWRSGLEQQASGAFPRVCWLVPTEHRRAGIHGVLARIAAEIAGDLFSVALAADGPAVLTRLPNATGGQP